MAKHLLEKYFPTTITKKQASDTGMAMVLILLLIGYFKKLVIFYKIAIPVLVMNMAFPMFFFPFAVLWLGLTTLLGEVVSRVLLSVIYFIILFPVSVFRRMMGKDTLDLTAFKKSSTSVMVTRNHDFTSKDIEHPY